jgi:hypothetical protein
MKEEIESLVKEISELTKFSGIRGEIKFMHNPYLPKDTVMINTELYEHLKKYFLE